MNNAHRPSAPDQRAGPKEDYLGLITRLDQAIEVALANLIDLEKPEHSVLLDFPNHSNVGDSAIWTGEIAYLKQHMGRPPDYATDQNVDWERVDRVAQGGMILIHGGGNFGDLWPKHQEFRHTLLDRYKGTRIVQLPQSIHFSDPAAVGRTAEAIARHGAFTLLVRDHESFELARLHFACDVRLCPDMAFALGPLRRPQAPTHDVLMLLRTDHEARPWDEVEVPSGWLVEDWLRDERGFRHKVRLRKWLRNVSRGEAPWSADRRHEIDIRAERRVARGLALLARARFIVTDRLHVHILATLMGIPHVILDNSYGKIHRFSVAFGTASWGGVTSATTLPEAVDIARRSVADLSHIRVTV